MTNYRAYYEYTARIISRQSPYEGERLGVVDKEEFESTTKQDLQKVLDKENERCGDNPHLEVVDIEFLEACEEPCF